MGPAGTACAKLETVCSAFLREDEANTTTEYMVMASIIIVGLIAVLSPFSDRVEEIYARIDAQLAVTTDGG